MDISLIIGLVGGAALMIISMALGGSISAFWNVSSVMITCGGALAALMVNFPFQELARVGGILKVAFMNKSQNPLQIIQVLVEYAEVSRREGLLALEEKSQDLDDPFLQKGIQLVVDGTDPELVRNILEIELSYMEERHSSGAEIFEKFGAYLPAFGMVGTLIGLILMLREIEDPSSLGVGMAVALITTLYGAVLANLVFLPIAGNLRVKSAEEVLVKEIMIEGILSIRAGENPRIVEEKLNAFLPRIREMHGGEAYARMAEEVSSSA